MDPLADDYLLDEIPGGIIASRVELTDAQIEDWKQRWLHQHRHEVTIVIDDHGARFDP